MAHLAVIILAAGQGQRMASNLPKVLHRLAGRAMVEHVIEAAFALAPEQVVVVHSPTNGEQLKQHLAPWEKRLSWAEQRQARGTGDAVAAAVSCLQPTIERVLVLYGDVPLVAQAPLAKLAHATAPMLLALHLEHSTGYGRLVFDAAGGVARIIEEQDASAEEKQLQVVNTGVMAVALQQLRSWLERLEPHNAQQELYLTDVVALAYAEGSGFSAVLCPQALAVRGVNRMAELALLEREWQRQQAEQLMASGTRVMDPARIDIRGQLRCGREVEIDIGCVFEGDVELGDGVKVGPYALIRDSRIGAGVQVKAFSHIEGADLAPRSSVGPYARLRPGTVLAQGASVGNFVEVKNTRLGAGSKAGHLSYLGDAEIGAGVNIGAGVITCNYDGVNKHTTVIEDGAFIGSDSQLVAPVRVGKNALIGAGTSLRRDAPAEHLTLSASVQRSLKKR